ncbi:MAG: GntR family transcriptional regulator [Desulfobacterales bacterium]|nr:GntR family transcriptional regulator [Desulfobacterales bacterium]
MKKTDRPKSLVTFITEDLEEKILEGKLKPGQRLIESDLCKTYGVSQTPLRESLRILESQGYLVHEPRKGVSVTQITLNDIEEIYHIRASLESLAHYWAVKRYDPEVLAQLKNLQKQMRLEVSKKNVKAYFELNLKFHEILINACRNKRLINMIQTFVKQTKRYRTDILQSPERLKRSMEAHEKIIRSFEDRDAEKAERLRKESILGNIQVFEKKFKEEKTN